MPVPVIVFRVGWMRHYKGQGKIQGGGEYVDENREGGEMWNFLNEDNKCYGYVMSNKFAGVDLKQIFPDRRWREGDFSPPIDIVFIATRPEGGQVIIGWYRNATIFHKQYRERKKSSGGNRHYLCKVTAENATLLKEENRTFEIPAIGTTGYPGQSNVWYASKKNPVFSETLRNYIYNEIEDRVAIEINANNALPNTERQQLIQARIGQGLFRNQLIDYWEGECCLTGCELQSILKASHIKPWKDCTTHEERLDVYNGLLLSPNMDALFDKGFISFTDEGEIMISPQLQNETFENLGGDEKMTIQFEDEHLLYLDYHREYVFKAR
jgi:predicted restriction endonuclease